jgi:shikimate 5-dehydrogenase
MPHPSRARTKARNWPIASPASTSVQCQLFYDLNYGRRTNFWQQRATALDIDFKDGISVLAFQARRTFSLWTGMDVPPETFLKALK